MVGEYGPRSPHFSVHCSPHTPSKLTSLGFLFSSGEKLNDIKMTISSVKFDLHHIDRHFKKGGKNLSIS